jgi:hypothetical protein
MTKEKENEQENFKLVYEQILTSVRYFLDWRYKLFVGYIVVISALHYFIIAWNSKQENSNNWIYILSCFAGVLLSGLFFFINLRINQVIWKHQNNGYLYEKRLGMIDIESDKPVYGLFGTTLDEQIKQQVDKDKVPVIKLKWKDKFQFFKLTHVAIMNWFFLLGGLSFGFYFFLE